MDAGADEAEVFKISSTSTDIEVLGQKIESINIKEETGLGLRIFKNGRLGFAYATYTSDELTDGLIEKALANSAHGESDEFNHLPKRETSPSKAGKQKSKLHIYDESISKTPIEKKIEIAMEIEAAAYSLSDKVKKTEKAVYHDYESEIRVINSNGIDVTSKQNLCGGFIEIIAEDSGQMEGGVYSIYLKAIDKLNPAQIGERAAKRAVELLGAKSISPERLDLVFDTTVAESFLEALFPLFSSDFVQKNKSALKGRIGGRIGPDILNLIDDGTLRDGLSSIPFDSEGGPTQETVLIENGILKGYLYNNYTALKEGAVSTGNGIRGSFKGLPQVSPTNFYIKPGSVTPEDMIKGVSRGLYVTRVMGMHTVNPISGDFSVGAAGLMIEGGRKTFPVRGITIAGNLIELLKNIKAIGCDLELTGSMISPTLLIEGITVSGI